MKYSNKTTSNAKQLYSKLLIRCTRTVTNIGSDKAQNITQTSYKTQLHTNFSSKFSARKEIPPVSTTENFPTSLYIIFVDGKNFRWAFSLKRPWQINLMCFLFITPFFGKSIPSQIECHIYINIYINRYSRRMSAIDPFDRCRYSKKMSHKFVGMKKWVGPLVFSFIKTSNPISGNGLITGEEKSVLERVRHRRNVRFELGGPTCRWKAPLNRPLRLNDTLKTGESNWRTITQDNTRDWLPRSGLLILSVRFVGFRSWTIAMILPIKANVFAQISRFPNDSRIINWVKPRWSLFLPTISFLLSLLICINHKNTIKVVPG